MAGHFSDEANVLSEQSESKYRFAHGLRPLNVFIVDQKAARSRL